MDPLLALTGQAYAYAAGSPLNITDPTGLDNLNLARKCQALEKKIEHLKDKIERAERNLQRNINNWPENDPNRIKHKQDLENYRQYLKANEEKYAAECCNNEEEPESAPVTQPTVVPEPAPTPIPAPTPQACYSPSPNPSSAGRGIVIDPGAVVVGGVTIIGGIIVGIISTAGNVIQQAPVMIS